MALTAEQIQQMAAQQGGGFNIYDMVRNGQLSMDAVTGALGQGAVDDFLSRNQLTAPAPTTIGPPTDYGSSAPLFQLGSDNPFPLGASQTTNAAPQTGAVTGASMGTGNVAGASMGTGTVAGASMGAGTVTGTPTGTGTVTGNTIGSSPTYTPTTLSNPQPTTQTTQPSTTTQPTTQGAQQTTQQQSSGNGSQLGTGPLFNTQTPGGTTQNNNYNQYPTPIPTSPDYEAAANQQGQANLDAAKSTIALSNPNVNTTYGSQTYAVGPDGRPVQNQTLSPDQQKRLDDLNSILPSVTNNIREQTARPISSYDFQDVMDLDNITLPERQTQTGVQGQSAVAEALRAREQPRLDRKRQQMEAQLLTRGFNPGTEGWNEAMDDLSRSENDFNLGLTALSGQEQSRLFDLDTQNRNTRRSELESLFGAQMAKRQGQIGEQITARTLPIQEYASLVQAMQPNLPNFQPYTGTTVEANPIFQAANQKGLFDLGRYSTSVGGELGTRGVDAQKGSALFNNILGLFGLS